MDAGHFIHRNSLDFDLINIQPQCAKCNRYLSGNLGVFAYRLKNKYGLDEWDRLEGLRHKERHFNRQEYLGIINDFKDKLQNGFTKNL